MPVDVSIILSQLATSWGLLTHSVNQIVQAGRGDPHRVHLQMNEVAHFENVYQLHQNLLDTSSRSNIDVGLHNICHLLREAALTSSDPPKQPPILVQGSLRHTGRGSRPCAAIDRENLHALTESYGHGSTAKIATLLGFHPRTIWRYQLGWGFVPHGLALRQLEFIDETGRAHYRHHSSLPTMSSLSDEELDTIMAAILRDYPNYVREYESHGIVLMLPTFVYMVLLLLSVDNHLLIWPTMFLEPIRIGIMMGITISFDGKSFCTCSWMVVPALQLVSVRTTTTDRSVSFSSSSMPRSGGEYLVVSEAIAVLRTSMSPNGWRIIGEFPVVHISGASQLSFPCICPYSLKMSSQSLEHHHSLNLHLNRHIWLLHHLFLAHIDSDANIWAEHWNNHKMSLKGCRASPLQMWMESQLLHGARGLEHLTADDPRRIAPFAAVPNMGLNKDMLRQLQAHQRVHIEAPDSVPQNLAYVACEPPNNPFSPEQLVQFDARLNAVVPDVDQRMEYRHLHWIHGLAIMTLILSPSGQALPPDL
ncbi:hypothetical protein EV421DRAFT_1907820 [Armillaria borealis]|uniref:Integrase core domain-containing protein n=1 Tax=Armillaria borealis TaxID=47425 RepID=A0AA39MJM5_9AGAR|nr:hypothetical protein EV421DRAFT_1907820 [Armillaria borealis]